MKFTITRERLQEGLVAVAATVPTKTTLPVLANILIEATSEGIRLSATDLDIAVSTVVPAEVDTEGSVTVPAKKLVDIVRELPSAAVRITGTGEQRVSLDRETYPTYPVGSQSPMYNPNVRIAACWPSESKRLSG